MANSNNLKRGNPATQFSSGRVAVENGRKGGKAKAQKEKEKKAEQEENKTMLSELQLILDSEYTTTNRKTGETTVQTGRKRLLMALFVIASDPKSRQCIQAQRLIYELMGENRTPEQIEREQLTNEKLRKEIEALTEGNAIFEPVKLVIQPRDKDEPV